MAREDLVLMNVKKVLGRTPGVVWVRGQLPTGWPDIIACIGGRFVGIEVKDDVNGTYGLTMAQKRRLKKIYQCGGVAAVVDKNSLDDFVEFVEVLVEDRQEGVYFNPGGVFDDEIIDW